MDSVHNLKTSVWILVPQAFKDKFKVSFILRMRDRNEKKVGGVPQFAS